MPQHSGGTVLYLLESTCMENSKIKFWQSMERSVVFFLCINSAYSIHTIPNPHFCVSAHLFSPNKAIIDATHGRAVVQKSNQCAGTRQFKHEWSTGTGAVYFDMSSDFIPYVMGCVCPILFFLSSFYFSDKSVRNMCGSDIVVLQYVLIATNHNFFHCMQLQVLARDSWMFLFVVQCSYFHVYLISTCYISLQWDQIKYSLVLVLQIHKEMLSSGISIFLQTSLKNKAKGILCLLPM